MEDKVKWWLISDDDQKEIGGKLREAGLHDALHTLDSGLHKTDEIPDDYKGLICPECGEYRPDDERVKNGMKCGQCAYGSP